MSLRTFFSATRLFRLFGREHNYLAHSRALVDASLAARITVHLATMWALFALPGLKVTVRDIIYRYVATSYNARRALEGYVVERTLYDYGALPARYSGLKLTTSVGIHTLQHATFKYPPALAAQDCPETPVIVAPILSPPNIIVSGHPQSPRITSPALQTPHLSYESHTVNDVPGDLFTMETPLDSPVSHLYTLTQFTGVLPRTHSGHIYEDGSHLLPSHSKYLDIPVAHTAVSPPHSQHIPFPPVLPPTILDLHSSQPSHNIGLPQPSSFTISEDDLSLDIPDEDEELSITEPISGATFTLKGQLARGAFGRVMYATTACGQIRAIKVINKAKQITSHSGAMNLSREQRVYIRITRSHSRHISPLLLLWSDYINTYFVQPLYPESLLNRIWDLYEKDKSLTLQEMKLYASELLLALAELHSLKLVHRDIKLGNILISESGHLVLADFGLCMEVNDKKSLDLAGTPGYQAPELLQGEMHGYPADIWSLGMVFLQMFTGDPGTYFDQTGFNTQDINDSVLSDLPIELENHIEDNHTRDVVSDMLYRDPTMRPTIPELFQYPFFTIDINISQVEAGVYNHSYRPTVKPPDSNTLSDFFCDVPDLPREQLLKIAHLHKNLRYECDWWCESDETPAGPSGPH